MLIDFGNLSANQKTDKSSDGTQVSGMGRTNGFQRTVQSQNSDRTDAYSVVLNKNQTDTLAYQEKNKATDELMQSASSADVKSQQNYMTIMSNTMSQEDFSSLQEDGFKPGEVEVEKLVTVVDQIKAKLAEAGVTIEGYNDDLDMDKLKEITGSSTRAIQITEKLKENDISVTEETVSEVNTALQEGKTLGPLSEGTVSYLVQNKLEPTLEQVYLAQFCGASTDRSQGAAYFADSTPGYYGKKADTTQIEQLTEQINKVVTQAGYEADETTLAQGKWMVEKGIPLTAENFTKVKELNEIQLPLSDEALLERITSALVDGKSAKQATLWADGNSKTVSSLQKAVELVNTVEGISDAAVEKVVKDNLPLTIRNLQQAQLDFGLSLKDAGSEIGTGTDASAIVDVTTTNAATANTTTWNSTTIITAKRQLEETRLSMSVQANWKLLKSGYQIETTELSKLVEDLKSMEKEQNAILFKTTSDESEESVTNKASLYSQVQTKVSEIGQMPAAILGKIKVAADSTTLQSIYEEGVQTKNTLESAVSKATSRYETVMTVPRADLGDSIKKAFQNVDDILEDLNLEKNEYNQRAVRILGYNNMAVTEEAIATVKEADITVRQVIEKMTPQTTLSMIREDKNPLTMSVKELEDYLNNQGQSTEEQTEKYSKFLYKLEKNNEITKEEKESYIGIYRLFSQIEKSDGAVIGSLVNQGAELSMKNLLTQVRNRSKKGMDYSVDDSFGGVEQSQKSGTSISDQINTSFYQKLSAGIFDKLDPEKLSESLINENISLEELALQLQTELQESKSEDSYRREQFEDFSKAMKVEESVVGSLIGNNQTVTADNIMASMYLSTQRGGTFKKLFDLANAQKDKEEVSTTVQTEQGEESSAFTNLKSAMTNLQTNFTDAEAAETAFESLVEVGKEMLYDAGLSENTYIDVKAANLVCKQLSLAGNLAREENYEIPLDINGEITSVNLKILHNKGESGKVTATMETEQLGKVGAEFVVGKEGIRGFIACSTKEGTQILKDNSQRLEQELPKDQKVNQIFYAHGNDVNLNNFGTKSGVQGEEISTSTLYEIGKAFIISIQNL